MAGRGSPEPKGIPASLYCRWNRELYPFSECCIYSGGRASGLKNPLLHGGQYYLVKGCRCILGDQGSVLEILGPGGWRILHERCDNVSTIIQYTTP